MCDASEDDTTRVIFVSLSSYGVVNVRLASLGPRGPPPFGGGATFRKLPKLVKRVVHPAHRVAHQEERPTTESAPLFAVRFASCLHPRTAFAGGGVCRTSPPSVKDVLRSQFVPFGALSRPAFKDRIHRAVNPTTVSVTIVTASGYAAFSAGRASCQRAHPCQARPWRQPHSDTPPLTWGGAL